MAVTRLTCPECKTVLQPAKPLPAGKSVKCPECGNRFTATEDEPDVPLKRPKRAGPDDENGGDRRPKKPAVRKAAPDKAAPPQKPAPAKAADEEEEGGTYRFVDAGEHADDEKPDINYAPDMSIKDLRGPAQSALVRPSNALILTGALGFFGWLLLLILILIPTLFPIDNDEGDKTKPSKPVVGVEHGLGAVNDEKDPLPEMRTDPARRSMFNFFGINVSAVGVLAWYLFILALTPIFLGMVYSGIVTYGGVKIQNLEGRGWGIAASIMAMIPLNSWGFMMSTTILLQFLLSIILDDARVPLIGLMVLETLLGIGVGVWVLLTLMSEKVIKGYEYKPE